MAKVRFTTPIGRLVAGSLYKGRATDADGNPLVYKSGGNIGQPRLNYFMALAVPKVAGQHWNQTTWGKAIHSAGAEAFPAFYKVESFSWKILDGDDQTPKILPNGKTKRNCDNEGYPGNWVLKFQGSFAPAVFRLENGAYFQITEDGYVKTGWKIQIAGTVDGNKSNQRPGVFLNYDKILFSDYDREIVYGISAEEAFAGASDSPTAPPATSGFPVPPPVPAAISAVPTYQTQVVPKPSFLMTPKAAGASHEAFKAAGWDDSKLIADGYMVVS